MEKRIEMDLAEKEKTVLDNDTSKDTRKSMGMGDRQAWYV